MIDIAYLQFLLMYTLVIIGVVNLFKDKNDK
jgi:hypothetical protein